MRDCHEPVREPKADCARQRGHLTAAGDPRGHLVLLAEPARGRGATVAHAARRRSRAQTDRGPATGVNGPDPRQPAPTDSLGAPRAGQRTARATKEILFPVEEGT